MTSLSTSNEKQHSGVISNAPLDIPEHTFELEDSHDTPLDDNQLECLGDKMSLASDLDCNDNDEEDRI